MGNALSTKGSGAALLEACARGDEAAASALLASAPSAVAYSRSADRASPLLAAAGAGHGQVVELLVEAAVIAGADRAAAVINHADRRGMTALLLAAANGHAAVVEHLLLNGADPLVLDRVRHSTALIWAAAHCHADCVARLVGGRAAFRLRGGASCRVADIPCYDEDGT